MYTDPQAHAWQFWLDRPHLVAQSVITFNVPDAATADLQKLQSARGETLEDRWYKVPFTPALLEAIASSQKEDDFPLPPGSP